MVKSATGLGDDKLDEKYANPDDKALVSRLRIFFRIRALGTSPDATQGYRTRESVYEIANRKSSELLASAKRVFESEIWDLLQRPDRRAADFTQVINVICGRRGWYRAQPTDRRLGVIFLGDDEPAFQVGLSPPYHAMLQHLMEAQPDLDALTLLVALFREAYGSFELDRAVAIRSALGTATALYCEGVDLPYDIRRTFFRLIWDRITHNRIANGDAGREKHQDDDGAIAPAQRLKAFIQHYHSGKIRDDGGAHPGAFAIVAGGARIDWLRENCGTREAGVELIAEADRTIFNHEDSGELRHRPLVERVKILGEKLLAAPPPRDGTGCLPTSNPRKVISATLDEMFEFNAEEF